MSQTNGKHPVAHTDPYWCGRFAFAIAHSIPRIRKSPEKVEHDLRETLKEFLRSPLAAGALGKTLRKEMR